jgi:hypothetical protein
LDLITDDEIKNHAQMDALAGNLRDGSLKYWSTPLKEALNEAAPYGPDA